jgi:hypothetical protein
MLPPSHPRRYDEFGRRKRSKNEEDKRAREAAALQRLYGGTNLAPSELVGFVWQMFEGCNWVWLRVVTVMLR